MDSDKSYLKKETKDRYMVWFFAGGETNDNKFNIFTGSFIRLMKKILEDDFEFIKGVYFNIPMMNVIWALSHAQKPVANPEKNRIIAAAEKQLTTIKYSQDAHLVITSSSSGSIVAAQTACFLAEINRDKKYFTKPFHLVLGASMLSPESDLYRQLIHYQKEGIIGEILHNEVQDEGDSSFGVGGISRWEAYTNALELILPIFSEKFKRPSFLNTHPEKGHIHRRRSQTIQKAIDYINIILIVHKLAGDLYMEKALMVVKEELVKGLLFN
jgi:hypothetical protein